MPIIVHRPFLAKHDVIRKTIVNCSGASCEGGAKYAAKYIARPTNTRQFDERANGSLSQHASAVLVVSLFRHWLLNCMAFYFQAPCAGAHASYEVGPSSELLIALGVRQGTLYCFYPRMPRTLVMPLVMVAYALCLRRIPTFLL